MDDTAPNIAERIKRKNFCLNNGFEDLQTKIQEGEVIYDILGVGGTVTNAEYQRLIFKWMGRFMSRLITMEMSEPLNTNGLNPILPLNIYIADGSEGVAESETPYGHFTNARRITMNGEPIKGIDPSVLVDNGRIYYIWGQGETRMGEGEKIDCENERVVTYGIML